MLNDSHRQLCSIDWNIDITQNIWDRTDMILMTVCDKKSFDPV